MKLWVVSHAYVAPVNHDKLLALAAQPGIELTLLVPSTWRTAFGVAKLPRWPVPYRVIPTPVLLSGRVGGYIFCKGLMALRRARPDIVHAEVEPWSLAALQCVLAAGGARVVLFTWENLDGPRRRTARLIERFVLRRVAYVIAGNEAARARVLRLGVPADRAAVLPQFGVDPARYSAGDPARVKAPFPVVRPRPRPIVGYVGRLVPEKGIDVLVAAVDQSLDVRLLIVGEGPARADLETLIARAGRLEAHFTGAVAGAAIPDYLAAMDVVVLPSRTTDIWTEQFGHVLIEAMAAGVPVIGSSAGAIPEVVGGAGLVFPEGDVGALRAQLRRLLEDEVLRKTLVERGRERVRTRYTNAIVARAQCDIYRRLV